MTSEIKGTNGVVTLRNTDATDIEAANEVLTGVYIDVPPGAALADAMS